MWAVEPTGLFCLSIIFRCFSVLFSEFAESEPVPGFNDGTLQLAFVDLRQLLNLFLSSDWTTYFADYGKPMNKYLRVNPNTAIIILEK